MAHRVLTTWFSHKWMSFMNFKVFILCDDFSSFCVKSWILYIRIEFRSVYSSIRQSCWRFIGFHFQIFGILSSTISQCDGKGEAKRSISTTILVTHINEMRRTSHRVKSINRWKAQQFLFFFINICLICGLIFCKRWNENPKWWLFVENHYSKLSAQRNSTKPQLKKRNLTKEKQMERNTISQKWICIDCMLTLLCCALLSAQQKLQLIKL